ncbi:MAG: zinc-binding dehydrogenase, partial [Burkholderiaceae bacterium]
MKALVLGPDGPRITDAPRPAPGPDDVLVRVRACGLNRADLGMAAGAKHGAAGGAGAVLGMEFAGEVAETGANVAGPRAGDRVMCSGAGGFAEYAVANAARAVPIPTAAMSFEQAATLPVALQTMHDAVVTHGQLAAGGTVLIQGASSGVGLVAMQIARLRGAALVIGSSTDAARRARLAEFGAHLAVDSSDPAWVDEVLKATGGRGVDLIVDQVSGSVANQNLRATRVLGRIVNVGRLGGMHGDFDFDLHALRRITYVGVTFRTRSVDEVREIVERMRADLGDDVAAGRIRLPIDRVFALDDALDALAHMRANRHFGKVVLRA